MWSSIALSQIAWAKVRESLLVISSPHLHPGDLKGALNQIEKFAEKYWSASESLPEAVAEHWLMLCSAKNDLSLLQRIMQLFLRHKVPLSVKIHNIALQTFANSDSAQLCARYLRMMDSAHIDASAAALRAVLSLYMRTRESSDVKNIADRLHKISGGINGDTARALLDYLLQRDESAELSTWLGIAKRAGVTLDTDFLSKVFELLLADDVSASDAFTLLQRLLQENAIPAEQLPYSLALEKALRKEHADFCEWLVGTYLAHESAIAPFSGREFEAAINFLIAHNRPLHLSSLLHSFARVATERLLIIITKPCRRKNGLHRTWNSAIAL